MTRVTVPVWVLVFCGLALVCSIAFALVMGTGNRDLRGDVERLKAGIRAAHESQRIIAGQLASAVLDGFELEAKLGDAMVRLERGQEYISELEKQIADSTNAGDSIGRAIDSIGEWIDRVEELNKGSEG